MTHTTYIHVGDCVEVMAGMEPESIDAIVTDPPYLIGFMGKHWDAPATFLERKSVSASGGFDAIAGNHHPTSQADVGRTALVQSRRMQEWHTRWATEALRVAKPGAYLLAFGGTRTVHRLACAIEDAGWVIRDTLVWAYAQGFPKSRSSLKPAWEPIVMARKPGPLRELAIDACRIGYASEADYQATVAEQSGPRSWKRVKTQTTSIDLPPTGGISANPTGRWPANVILTDPIFDGDWDGVEGGGAATGGTFTGPTARARNNGIGLGMSGIRTGASGAPDQYGDTGTYSRFFLIPKASRSDREPKVPGALEARRGGAEQFDSRWKEGPGELRRPIRRNTHPTVKPTELMRHLIRLVTPEGGIVLDPFLGSGTTAKAAVLEGVRWVGIEREAEYVGIVEQRLVGVEPEPVQLTLEGTE